MRYQYSYQPVYQNRTIYMSIGDKDPALEIKLVKDDTGVAVDLTAATGYIVITDSDSAQFESGALTISAGDAVLGVAKYYLQSGFTTSGINNCKFYLSVDNDGNYLSVPEGDLSYVIVVS